MKRFLALPFALIWLLSCGTSNLSVTGPGSELFGLGPTPGIAVTYHPSEAIYTVDLMIDGQKFPNVLIDTGSANLTVFGDSTLCPTCIPTSGITTFEPATFTPTEPALNNGQSFGIKFGVGSGTVQNYSALIGFENMGKPIEYSLGVYTKGQHLDNALGLGYAANMVGLPGSTPLPFLDLFIAQNNLANLFTLNFCQAQSGSFMTIGTIPAPILERTIHYTPIVPNSLRTTPRYDFYAVAPISIGFADALPFPFPTQKEGFLTIVDSGTAMLYLPQKVLNALADAYEAKGIPRAFWDVYAPGAATLAFDQFQLLKDIELEFPAESGPSFKVKIRPETYTIKSGTVETPVYYSAISRALDLNTAGSQQLVILGEVFLQNSYAIFDREKNRLGLTPNGVMCPR